MWRLIEPIHALTYFSSESRDAFRDAGLKGFWMGYFAGRSAPMGAVGPSVVAATFFNFATGMVRRSIPDAWEFSTPAAVLEARVSGVDTALRKVLGPLAESLDLEHAADLLRRAAEAASFPGRPLGAANAALDWPSDPLGVLWHATTVLREHRGDGHVVALCLARLDGCQAHISMVSTGVVGRSVLQPNRGWSDEEWDEAERSLVERGWIDETGRATDSGIVVRSEIEQMTDCLAADPWERLGEERCDLLVSLLKPLAKAVSQSRVVPTPNPIGLPVPE